MRWERVRDYIFPRTESLDGKHLAEGDPLATARNKFRLRRPSPHAQYELQLWDWRVFYRVREGIVEIVLIGEKRGNVLHVGGKEFQL